VIIVGFLVHVQRSYRIVFLQRFQHTYTYWPKIEDKVQVMDDHIQRQRSVVSISPRTTLTSTKRRNWHRKETKHKPANANNAKHSKTKTNLV